MLSKNIQEIIPKIQAYLKGLKARKFLLSLLGLMLALMANAQEPSAPHLTHALTLHVKCSPAMEVGATSMGKRIVIPIVGGTFEGESLHGEVLPGGADYQLVDTLHNRTHLEAIYNIRTSDGVMIHVRNIGVLANPKLANGKQGFYFQSTPVFEAPLDSKYAWLNDAVFVCTPFFEKGTIGLKVWKVN